MSRTSYAIEFVQGGYALTVNGEYKGRYGSKAAADRMRKVLTLGVNLDPRTATLVREAQAERARMMRG
jgi:hypothetical protein